MRLYGPGNFSIVRFDRGCRRECSTLLLSCRPGWPSSPLRAENPPTPPSHPRPRCAGRSASSSTGPASRSTSRSTVPRDEDGLVTERLSFASEKTAAGEERVPVLIVRPGKEGDEAAGRDRAARHRRHQGRHAALARRPGQARHHRRGHRRPLPRRPRRRGRRGRRPTTRPSPAPGRPSRASRRSTRSTTTPAGTCGGRSTTCETRDGRRPEADRHDRLQHGRHRDLAGRVGRRAGHGGGAGHRRAELPLEPGERPVAGPGQHDQGRPTRPRPRTWASRRSTARSAASCGARSSPASSTTSTARACSACSPAGRC